MHCDLGLYPILTFH